MSATAGRPLRVLHVPPRYFPYVGGVEELCRGYVRELARLGHQVTVLTADEGPPLDRVEGVPVRRCATAAKLANTNLTPSLPLHLLAARADVIHTYLPTPWSADWAAWRGRLRGKPVVLSYANDIVGQGLAGAVARAYNATALRLTLRAASRVLVLSPTYPETSPHLAPHRRKIQVLPPGVDTERFAPDDGPRLPATFFFLSILDEYHRYKGLDVLLRALAELRKSRPDARLIVGGRGALLGEYRALAASLGLEDAVAFRGYLPDDDVLALYRHCTAFVLPSISAAQEGFGMVALEAMACGAPVIVSNIVGMADRVAQEGSGLVTPAGDISALARALGTLAAGQTGAMGERARELAERRFAWPILGRELEHVYRQVLDERARG